MNPEFVNAIVKPYEQGLPPPIQLSLQGITAEPTHIPTILDSRLQELRETGVSHENYNTSYKIDLNDLSLKGGGGTGRNRLIFKVGA